MRAPSRRASTITPERKQDDLKAGLMHFDICGYTARDIKIVAAFDIDRRKVGRPFHEAIFAPPNCTKRIGSALCDGGFTVSMGNPLDGISPHMADYPEDRRFVLADNRPDDVVKILKDRGVRDPDKLSPRRLGGGSEVLCDMLPGSRYGPDKLYPRLHRV